jgi:hypothetical protein
MNGITTPQVIELAYHGGRIPKFTGRQVGEYVIKSSDKVEAME